MAVTVIIASPLRRLAGGRSRLEIEGGTVGEIISNLQNEAPGFRNRLLDDRGEVRRFLAVFLNGEDIRETGGAKTRVSDGDELELVPAAAGG
mgnify:CR=1 FL=1